MELRMTLTAAEAYEILDNYPEVKRLSFGKCRVTGDWDTTAMAHAHLEDGYDGDICFGEVDAFYDKQTLLHEIAHILTRQSHTEEWNDKLIELGGDCSAYDYGLTEIPPQIKMQPDLIGAMRTTNLIRIFA